MTTTFVGVAGLPNAGASLLCRMLAEHPEIHCEDETSPLGKRLLGGRRLSADAPFMSSPLDKGFDAAYGHLQSEMENFMSGWHYGAGNKTAVVDKNVAWLHCLELLLFMVPDARLIVCLRELGQIYGSMEVRQRRSALPEGSDPLFAKKSAIGVPLAAVQVASALPQAVRDRIHFVRFEDLMERRAACLSELFAWLDLPPFDIGQATSLAKPARHALPEHIQAQIRNGYAWYYERYYPEAAASPSRRMAAFAA